MAEAATQTPPVKTGDVKQTAANIVKGIQSKANGKAPAEQPADPKAAAEVPVDPNAGKRKFVVEGKDVWLTPEEADRYVQKGIAFEPRVTQLAKLQQETNAFMETLKTDPDKILFNPRIGHNPKAILERILQSDQVDEGTKEFIGNWYYENVVQRMKMTPEQRELLEKNKRLSEYERKEQEAKEMALKQENQARVEAAFNQIKANIAEAMKESGLPDNDTPLGAEMARMVADVMRLARFQRKTVTPKQAIEFVKNRIKSVQTAYYDSLDEETLVKEIGESNAEKVKKYFLKLVKESGKTPPKQTASIPRKDERKVTTPDEFHDYLEELKKKG